MPYFFCTNLYSPIEGTPSLPSDLYNQVLINAKNTHHSNVMDLTRVQQMKVISDLNDIIINNDPLISNIVAKPDPRYHRGVIFQVHFRDNSDLMSYVLTADESIMFIDAATVQSMNIF